MPDLPPDLFELLRQQYVKQDGHDGDFAIEEPILRVAIAKIVTSLGEKYHITRPLGRGGAGIVFQLRDTNLNLFRALKVPRPRKSELLDSVQNEIAHLRTLHHDHLISVYSAGEVDVPGFTDAYPYFVMDYVEGAQDLAACLRDKLTTVKVARDLSQVTEWLATALSHVADAVAFLHRHETLHFDVKPDNVLVDALGKPILSDLGFAKKKTNDAKEVVVGFTLFYAHPDLRVAYEHMSSQNRVTRRKAPSEFQYTWDLYALGRTILQLLATIDQQFPDVVMYDYIFVYLHLMACRMLDGRNLAREESDRIRQEQRRRGEQLSVYLEHWLTLQGRDLGQLKYHTAEDVRVDFKKLRDPNYVLQRIPELNPHYPHRVQVSVGSPAPFSIRVKRIVEHPVVIRLRAVKQLGITETVYPGCTHTRLEHSLGTFRTCWLFVQSLLNDPYNPLFRQLTNVEDLSALLLAALLHDVGQYPLAHELEDAAPQAQLPSGKTWKEVFRHETLSVRWLKNTSVDADGKTLGEIIEDKDWGWGTPIERVARLIDDGPADQLPLLGEDVDIRLRLLQSIISGPLDVDKLDYLIRDSKRADLPYGRMIDGGRLARSLTVVLTKDEEKRTLLTLGAYEKGQSAAEAITFVRYELYQSLYWHHTVRAIRPMLREVLRQIPRDKKWRKQSCEDAFISLLGIDATPAHLTVDSVLDLLSSFTSDVGNELLQMIAQRRPYKRLLTIHSSPEEEGKEDFLQRFRAVHGNIKFDEELQKEIREGFEQYVIGVDGPRPSALGPQSLTTAQSELLKPGRILCDCPSPRTGSTERLRFALEPKRRLQNYATRVEIAERVSEVWQQVNYRLMAIASKGRVYCHPLIRDALMSALGPDGVRKALERVVAREST